MKEKIIQDFIKTNSRVPSVSEIDYLLREAEKAKPGLLALGESIYDRSFKDFQSIIDGQVIEGDLQSVHRDHLATYKMLTTKSDELVQSVNENQKLLTKLASRLRTVNGKMDSLLLCLNGLDEFIRYGYEDFSDLSHFVNGNLSIDSNVAYSRKSSLTMLDLTGAQISYAINASNNYTLGTVKGNINDLFKTNSFFTMDLFSSSPDNIINLIIDIDVGKNVYIDVLDFKCIPQMGLFNSSISIYTSSDGSYYTLVEPSHIALDTESTMLQIKQTVRKIRLLVTKNSADDLVGQQWLYNFNINQLLAYTTDFLSNDQSYGIFGLSLSLGYEDDDEYAVSKVILETCDIRPDDSSIKWYVGPTEEGPWTLTDPYNPGASVTVLGLSNTEGNYSLVDTDYSKYSLLNAGDYELVLPYYIKLHNIVIDNSKNFPTETLSLRRNVHVVNKTVNGIPSGWAYNNIKQGYETNFVCDRARAIDFGPYQCKLNGQAVTGLQNLSPGVYHFFTDESNWLEISPDILDASTFAIEDIMYPYNHRYLIEGYPYDNNFIGTRVYSGFDVFYSQEYKLKSVEEILDYPGFAYLPSINDNLYILVNIGESRSWAQESWSLDWRNYRNEADGGSWNNKVYVKFVLTNSTTGKTPIVKWIRIRGI